MISTMTLQTLSLPAPSADKYPNTNARDMGNDNSGGEGSSSPPASASSSSNAGVSKAVKLALLVILCLQNAVYTMLRRYRCV